MINQNRVSPRGERLNAVPRAVGIFDVLGVKVQIQEGRAGDLANSYGDLLGMINTLSDMTIAADPSTPRLFTETEWASAKPQVRAFSDTIIVLAPDESFAAGARVLILAWRLLQSFIAGKLPLRGAVAFGELHTSSDLSLVVGPALVKAHTLEARQAWAGGAIDESFLERYPLQLWEDQRWTGLFDRVFPIADVPMKGSAGVVYEQTRAVNWRTQLVRDVGLSYPILQKYGRTNVDQLHPYLQEMFTFARNHEGFLEPETSIPLEFRKFWIGNTPPPFPVGPERWD